MRFLQRLGVYLSGASNRQEGIQSGEPSGFGDTALPVTLDSAMQLSSVFACLRLIAETVSSLPINIYKIQDGVRSLAVDHPLQILMNGKVNAWQTRQEFFETMTYQLAAKGNAYAVKQKNASGKIIGLLPLMSEQMEVTLGKNMEVIYKYTDGSNLKVYSQETIWHVKLMGNGVIGLSPLDYARSSIGIGQAVESSVTSIYKNGGKPSGILTIDQKISKEQRKQIKDSFSELSQGNQNRLFVLEHGMQYHQTSLSPQDIELLSSRRFQIEDICRFFGVPSVLVNDTSSNTTWGSGIQQIVQGFYKLGLRPYMERYEASMKAWLLPPQERAEYDIEFDFNALLRPDQYERVKMYKEAIQGGVMTPNEARSMEGWKDAGGGDKLLVQQQMIPIEQAGTTLGAKNDQQL